MKVSFTDIISCACDKMKEYDFLTLGEENAEAILKCYIRPACAAFCDHRGTALDVDDVCETVDGLDNRDEMDILGAYVCIKYIDANYVRTTLTMKPFLSGMDFHAYDNKGVLAQVLKAQEQFKSEVNSAAVCRSYTDRESPFWSLHKNRK